MRKAKIRWPGPTTPGPFVRPKAAPFRVWTISQILLAFSIGVAVGLGIALWMVLSFRQAEEILPGLSLWL